MDEFCEWTESQDEGNFWESECGGKFELMEGTPRENHMNYCSYCGRDVKEIRRGERLKSDASRAAKIKSLRGKYRDQLNSTERRGVMKYKIGQKLFYLDYETSAGLTIDEVEVTGYAEYGGRVVAYEVREKLVGRGHKYWQVPIEKARHSLRARRPPLLCRDSPDDKWRLATRAELAAFRADMEKHKAGRKAAHEAYKAQLKAENGYYEGFK